MIEKRSRVAKTLLLFTLTVLTRLPFTSKFLYNWDSVQYALATENFNITYHQPHPPGYIIYVAAGKALNLLTGDANRSFIIISILASALAVSSLYLFGAHVTRERDGIYAAILLVVNPVFWFYGEITSTYTLECLMAILIGWICFRVKGGEDQLAPFAGALLSLAGGIRQGTFFLLLPLVVFSLRKASKRHLLLAGCLFFFVAMAWAVPLVYYSGGVETYLQATRQLSKIDTLLWADYGPLAALRNISRLLIATAVSLHVLLPIALAFLLRFFRIQDERAAWEKWLVFWWIAPSVVAYGLHYGQPGYVLIYIPVILVYSPALIRGFLDDLKIRIRIDTGRTAGFRSRSASLIIMAIAGAAGTSLFLCAPWEASARSIASHDAQWGGILALSEDLPPDSTLVLTGFFVKQSFRHASYYLPEYLVYCIGAGEEGAHGWVFQTRNREPSYNLNRLHVNKSIALPPHLRYILILDDAIAEASDIPFSEITLTPESSAYLVELEGDEGLSTLVFEDYRLRLR